MGPWTIKEKMTTPHFTSEQKRTLKILTLINFLNYIDRDIIFGLVPIIMARFAVSYSQAGLLNTVFSIVHSVLHVAAGMGGGPVFAEKSHQLRRPVLELGNVFERSGARLPFPASGTRSGGGGRSGLCPGRHGLSLRVAFLVGFGRASRVYSTWACSLGGGRIALGPVLMGWGGVAGGIFRGRHPGNPVGTEHPGRRGASRRKPRKTSPHSPHPARAGLRVGLVGACSSTSPFIPTFSGVQRSCTPIRALGCWEASIVLGVTVTFAGIFGVLTGATLG